MFKVVLFKSYIFIWFVKLFQIENRTRQKDVINSAALEIGCDTIYIRHYMRVLGECTLFDVILQQILVHVLMPLFIVIIPIFDK